MLFFWTFPSKNAETNFFKVSSRTVFNNDNKKSFLLRQISILEDWQ